MISTLLLCYQTTIFQHHCYYFFFLLVWFLPLLLLLLLVPFRPRLVNVAFASSDMTKGGKPADVGDGDSNDGGMPIPKRMMIMHVLLLIVLPQDQQ